MISYNSCIKKPLIILVIHALRSKINLNIKRQRLRKRYFKNHIFRRETTNRKYIGKRQRDLTFTSRKMSL